VEDWCERHGVKKCFIRRIDEVTRGVTQREEYEKVSREIRFGFYKEVVAKLGSNCGSIMFGHHQVSIFSLLLSLSLILVT
jgi:hypothetical protein